MAYLESEAVRVIDKFQGEKFSLWKFKMEMALASVDLWDIVDGSEKAPPSNADPKVLKEYQRRVKKAMSIIVLNLADNQLAHVKSCKGPAEAWKILCNIHETKSLSNILFVRRKFFTCKMDEGEDLLDHVNKVKGLADQLACLEVPVREEDIVMTLLESLPASYEFLITALETMPMKELTMEYVTARLMHEMSKRKEKEPQGEEVALVSRQSKGGDPRLRQGVKTCFYCGKPGHIARFCYKAKNKEKESANNAKVEDEFAFATKLEAHSRSVCKWIMDSGATKHMTSHRTAFDTYEVISPRNVRLSDGSAAEAIGMGSIVVGVEMRGKATTIRITDVLHVPKLQANLLSVSKLLSKDLKVRFDVNECIVRGANGEVVAIARREGNLYLMTFKELHGAHSTNLENSRAGGDSVELWHHRLGHLDVRSIYALQSMVKGINLGKTSPPTTSLVCEACTEGKQYAAKWGNNEEKLATKPLEIVHSGVCGPMRTTSIGGARYFVTFVDDYSRKVWVYTMKCKGEWFERFKEFQALVETQSGHKIKAFRCMSGGDFISKEFEAFLMERGIENTPQYIGPAGCAIQSIVAMAKRMLEARKLEKSFWAEAVANAVYTLNRCPTKALTSVTPEEMWSGRRPCVAHMRVFGSVVYAMVPEEKRDEFNAKRTKCIFLGYCEGMEAYRLMCLQTKKIIKSGDVVFMEDSGSISIDLEMRPSGRDGGRTMVEVDESSKSTLLDGGKETVDDMERVGGNGNVIEESCEKSANNDIFVENLDEERRYPTRERRPLGEWWKNHILPQRGEERANVAIVEDPLSWNEAIRVNMGKLMSNVRSSLHRMEKLRKSRVLQVFDYSQSGSVGSGALGCS